jgi:hypothetical protein
MAIYVAIAMTMNNDKWVIGILGIGMGLGIGIGIIGIGIGIGNCNWQLAGNAISIVSSKMRELS